MPSISAAALVRIPLTWGVINRFGRQCNRRKASCTLGDLMHVQGLHRVAWVHAPIRELLEHEQRGAWGPAAGDANAQANAERVGGADDRPGDATVAP